jgi:hypothetical protein
MSQEAGNAFFQLGQTCGTQTENRRSAGGYSSSNGEPLLLNPETWITSRLLVNQVGQTIAVPKSFSIISTTLRLVY